MRERLNELKSADPVRSTHQATDCPEDLRVPAGLALANTGAGIGGGGQFFLRKARAQRLLRPVGTWHLH